MRISVLLLAFCLLFAISASAQQPATKGIYVSDLDRSVDPCDDFYEFSNGKWRAENPIPASQVRWSRRFAAGELAKDQLKGILDETTARRDWRQGSVEQQIGDFYGSCMDEQRVNQLGLKPIESLLQSIEKMKTAADVQKTIGDLHWHAVFVPFGLASSPDAHEPTRVIADIYAAGLGLPDRDYYFKPDARFKEARERYRVHVANMFKLAGSSDADAKAAADRVFDIETKLAEASLDNVALRDPAATDHPTTFPQLRSMAPGLDWNNYFKVAKLPQGDLNVQEPKFLQRVDGLVKQVPVSDWKLYFRWHTLRSAASFLPDAFVNERFEFNDRFLRGAKEMKPRWKRCVEASDALLGEALGKKYTDKYFPPAAKARMQEMVRNLLSAMGDTIRGLEWMGPETKKKALEKLATFNPKIGYPDKWKDYSSVAVRRDMLWQNVAAARKFLVEDDRFQIGKPVDRSRWAMTPPTSNAYYNPLLNEIVFPAGILQPPAFNMEATDAINYGAIGVVIGHEISHGFDDQGAQFDAQGRLKNWWTDDDLKRFQERGRCVVEQFEEYFIEPGIHHNGKLVLGESIGDQAGAKIAYRAYQKSRQGKEPEPTFDGFTPDQQFFIGWGQFRGDAIRPETQRLMVQTDPHPTGKYRVIGSVSNMPEFQKTFSCKAGSAMVRPLEKRCEVW